MINKVKLFGEGRFLPVIEHEIVAVQYTANSTATRFLLPDVPNLRESEIVGFEVYTDDSVAINPNDGVTPVVDIADAKNSFITFQAYNGNNFYQQSPYLANTYIDTRTNAHPLETMQKQFQGQRINYPKSYIDFFPAAPIATSFVWLLSIYYIKRSDLPGLIGATFRNQS